MIDPVFMQTSVSGLVYICQSTELELEMGERETTKFSATLDWNQLQSELFSMNPFKTMLLKGLK